MARNKPFVIPKNMPRPLTVEETARKYGVSKRAMRIITDYMDELKRSKNGTKKE